MRRFGLVLLGFLWIVCTGCGSGDAPSPHYTVTVSGAEIAVNDANLFFSPYNWNFEGPASATSVQPGAYLTGRFQSENVRLDLDTSLLATQPNRIGPILRWQVDDSPTQVYQLIAGDVQIPLNFNKLTAGVTHTFKVWFLAADYRQDRWNRPGQALRITGLTLDTGGTTVAPTLLSKRILFFGDSITEGDRTESARNDPFRDDNATHAFTYTCAAALGAEFGVVGVARQGWTLPGQEGSNVPAFPASWTSQYNGQPRSFSPPPDYVVVMHGTNDALAPADPAQVQAAAQNWLVAARAALPSSRICLVVPFGGFERSALTQAVQSYKIAHTADTNVFLIDLGLGVQQGLTNPSGQSTLRATDGIHPTAAVSEALGTQLAEAIQVAAP